VLPGNNVFNMVSEIAMLLMQTTVLAAVASPVAHKAPHRGFHYLWMFESKYRWAFN